MPQVHATFPLNESHYRPGDTVPNLGKVRLCWLPAEDFLLVLSFRGTSFIQLQIITKNVSGLV